MELDTSIALVTGASRGIGYGIAKVFARNGITVIIGYNTNKELAENVMKELKGISDREHDIIQMELKDVNSINQTFESIKDKYGRLDILVNNAGYLKQQPLETITEEDWDNSLDINLKGTFFCLQQSFGIMKEQNYGSIVNISSVGGQIGGTKAPHYAAAKAAMFSLTKSFAKLGAPFNIRVNSVAPGYIDTDMYRYILTKRPKEEILDEIPLRKVGTIEDVGEAVLFLVSDKSNYITGDNINLNGGVYLG